MKHILRLSRAVALACCLTIAHNSFAQQPAKAPLSDFTQFLKELHACIERCPAPTGPELQSTLITKFKIVRDGEPIYEIYDGTVGRTTQAEINKLVGAGTFQWEGVVSEVKPSQQKPGFSIVYVPLPDIGKPPHDWQIDTKAIGFYTKDADLQTQKVAVGTRIVFAGTLAKNPDDFAGSGVTAYHGVGTKAGTNFIALRPDTAKISIIRVVGQAAK